MVSKVHLQYHQGRKRFGWRESVMNKYPLYNINSIFLNTARVSHNLQARGSRFKTRQMDLIRNSLLDYASCIRIRLSHSPIITITNKRKSLHMHDNLSQDINSLFYINHIMVESVRATKYHRCQYEDSLSGVYKKLCDSFSSCS